MKTIEIAPVLSRLFSELANGTTGQGGAFIVNSGDTGLLRALDALSAADASQSVNGGASIAAHALHLRYGLSLMNRWAREGGDPFADATWDAAWKIGVVDDAMWQDIRDGLRSEADRWQRILAAPRDVTEAELTGMAASVAHLAYHLGAIRQIHQRTRGPREGTFL